MVSFFDAYVKRKLFYILNLSAVTALTLLGVSVIAPVLPQYALSFDVSVSMVGWAVSAYGVPRLLMNLPAGVLTDKFGRKRNMVFGLITIFLGALIAGIAPGYGWLILGRILPS